MKTPEKKNLLGNQNTQKAVSRTLKRIIEHTKMVQMVYMHVEHAKAIVYMISSNTQLHLSVGVYVYIYICICTSCICLFWFSWMHFFLFRGKPATMDNPIWQSRPYTPQSVGLRIWLNYTCDSLALAVNKEELMGVNRFLIRQKGKFR